MMSSGDLGEGRTVFFEGARLIVGDGSHPVEGAGILVRDGHVVAAGPGVRPGEGDLRVDLAGKTVMPTIVNPHGHIGYFKGAAADRENFSRENVLDHLRRLTYYGVSVFQSLGTDRDDVELGIRDEQRAGTLDDPELALLYSAGNGLVAPTPGSDNGGPYFATDVIREVSTPAQARATVRELVAKNPDVIKFWVDDRNGQKRKFGPEIYSAIIDEAHQHGKKAIAHIYELEDAKGVVRAGVDGTAHMVRAPGPDEELLRLLTDNDVFVFTSMSIQKAATDDPAWFDDPYLAHTVDQASRNAIRAQLGQMPEHVVTEMKAGYGILEAGLRTYLQAGVRVLFSADTGLFAQFPGFAEHRELEAMVTAGMPALDAITAATLRPAQMLDIADRGSLEPGKRADFIVLDANPLDDIANSRKISAVYILGRAIDREKLRAGFGADDVPGRQN
jgi:imidazolonepropionase-like amidohydrolase